MSKYYLSILKRKIFQLYGHFTIVGHLQVIVLITQIAIIAKNVNVNIPKSIFLNQVSRNYKDKKLIFNNVNRLEIITPSLWLKNLVDKSFLKYQVHCINNGIDLNQFQPSQEFLKFKKKIKFKFQENYTWCCKYLGQKEKGLEIL